jgi:hypothetical protein
VGSAVESKDGTVAKQYGTDGSGQCATSSGQGLVVEEPNTSCSADAQCFPAEEWHLHAVSFIRNTGSLVPAASTTHLTDPRIPLEENVETSVAAEHCFRDYPATALCNPASGGVSRPTSDD